MAQWGTKLPIERTVDPTYDVGLKEGYGVKKTVEVEGFPTDVKVVEGLRRAIEEAGDTPVYVEAHFTYLAPDQSTSTWEAEFQAIHMGTGTPLVVLIPLIIKLLEVIAAILVIVFLWALLTVYLLNPKAVKDFLAGVTAPIWGVALILVLLVFGPALLPKRREKE